MCLERMKTSSLWIIRVALTVQFAGVLAVPALVAAAESPRALWIAEWLNPHRAATMLRSVDERSIGVLKLRDGKLLFAEQSSQGSWSIDLPSVKRIVLSDNARTLTVETNRGESFVMSIMDSNLTQASPKKVAAMIEDARQSMSASVR